jgi:hypothetical protein
MAGKFVWFTNASRVPSAQPTALTVDKGVQTPPEHNSDAAHAFPQVPQLLLSLPSVTHCVPHWVWPEAVLHALTQDPLEHTGVWPAQSAPHLPQLLLSEVKSTHPLGTPASWLQLVDFGGLQPHAPALQVAALTVQTWPQLPQFALSTVVNVHVPSQQLWPVAQPALQGARTSDVAITFGALASASTNRMSPPETVRSRTQASNQSLVTPAAWHVNVAPCTWAAVRLRAFCRTCGKDRSVNDSVLCASP